MGSAASSSDRPRPELIFDEQAGAYRKQLTTVVEPQPVNNRATEEKLLIISDTSSVEEVLEIVRESVEFLRSAQDAASEEVHQSLETIMKGFYYMKLRDEKNIWDELAERGLPAVFCRLWDSLILLDVLENHTLTASQNFISFLRLMWNYTDSSAKLCRGLSPSGSIRRLVGLLKDPQLDVAHLKSNSKRTMVKAVFGILHNHLRHCEDERSVYRQLDAVPAFSRYLKSSYFIVMCKALINLAYILNEDESEQLAAGSGNIKFLVNMVADALKQSNHVGKMYAFSAQETVEAIQHLAVNDKNKVLLVECGVLAHLVTMLGQQCQVQEQEAASKALWILAFNPSNTLPIQSEPGCLDALRTLKTEGRSSTLKQNCAGALWEIESKEAPERSRQSTKSSLGHIMISYQWDVQQRMVMVKDKLKDLGFKVWMDVENMGGDILGSMAEAVEKAECVLVCMSQNYKDSPNCRTEATYAFKLDKPVVPLMVQPDYQADGWLGALLGTTLYLPFYSPGQLDALVPSLVKELDNRGCGGAQRWTPEDVQSWLEENDLSPLIEQMRGWDGDLLWQLRKLSQRAPEYYHRTVEVKLQMFDLITLLKFNKALDKLS